MGKKKGGKKSKGPALSGPGAEVLMRNYRQACKNIGALISDIATRQMSGGKGDDAGGAYTQMNIGPAPGDPNELPIGPSGTRALMEGIFGKGSGMTGETYENLLAIRLYRCRIGCGGAVAVAELLRMAGALLRVNVLDLSDNGIGARGAAALGAALDRTGNKSVGVLRLDANRTLAEEEAAPLAALCRGLRTNATLRQLSLTYCDLPPAAGAALASFVGSGKNALERLDLKGNCLGPAGLLALAPAVGASKTLKQLDLFDNGMGMFPSSFETEEESESRPAFEALADALSQNATLETLDIDQNHLNPIDVEALIKGLANNKTLTTLLVDSNLDKELFAALSRSGGGKKKKGKGKKKKKKK
jgi:Ran GTPase-activating protein (RanGAP) involved in mRNA processing and transport